MKDETEQKLNYYQSAVENVRPQFVPARVRIPVRVYCDLPIKPDDDLFYVEAGYHDCESNQWGAISVKAVNGKMLGIKPKEFIIISLRHNKP